MMVESLQFVNCVGMQHVTSCPGMRPIRCPPAQNNGDLPRWRVASKSSSAEFLLQISLILGPFSGADVRDIFIDIAGTFDYLAFLTAALQFWGFVCFMHFVWTFWKLATGPLRVSTSRNSELAEIESKTLLGGTVPNFSTLVSE